MTQPLIQGLVPSITGRLNVFKPRWHNLSWSGVRQYPITVHDTLEYRQPEPLYAPGMAMHVKIDTHTHEARFNDIKDLTDCIRQLLAATASTPLPNTILVPLPSLGLLAPPRKRPRRVAKKLAQRGGYMRHWSVGALLAKRGVLA